MTNKDIAKDFLKLAGGGKVQEAYEKYVAINFIHHNQYFKGDRQSLLNAMLEAHKVNPNKEIEIKYIYEDGDTVITHSLVTRENTQDLAVAVVHIFRITNGFIVELWDLGQQIMRESPNENGLF